MGLADRDAWEREYGKPVIDERAAEMTRYYEAINSRTHAQILRNVRRIAKRKKRPNWDLAMEIFGLGSTFARILCVEAGIDPDGM